jgi:hypothetical protein
LGGYRYLKRPGSLFLHLDAAEPGGSAVAVELRTGWEEVQVDATAPVNKAEPLIPLGSCLAFEGFVCDFSTAQTTTRKTKMRVNENYMSRQGLKIEEVKTWIARTKRNRH